MIKLYRKLRENYFLNKYKRAIKFFISGIISASIDFGILFILVHFYSFNVIIANTISFSFAVINSFLFNKFWTFRNKDKNYSKQFFKFLIVSIIGLILNNLFLFIIIKFGVWYLFAKVIVTFIVLFWNFFINKFWTFNEK